MSKLQEFMKDYRKSLTDDQAEEDALLYALNAIEADNQEILKMISSLDQRDIFKGNKTMDEFQANLIKDGKHE